MALVAVIVTSSKEGRKGTPSSVRKVARMENRSSSTVTTATVQEKMMNNKKKIRHEKEDKDVRIKEKG